jgi:hypothetical protein
MSDKDRDLRKIPLAKAREMLQKEYNYSEEYLKGISRWEVISLVRYAILAWDGILSLLTTKV